MPDRTRRVSMVLSTARGRVGMAVLSAVVMVGVAVAVAVGTASGAPQATRTLPKVSSLPGSPALEHVEALTQKLECVKRAGLAGPGVPTGEADRNRLHTFNAVAAVSCQYAERRYPDGQWQVLLLRVAVRPINPLVAALDKPDGAYAGGTACALFLDVSPQLVLVNRHGDVLRPHFPRDSCGHMTAERPALDALRWHTLSVTKVQLDVPNDPVRRTCSTAWKDMIEIATTHTTYRPAEPLRLHGATILCIYRTDDPIGGKYERGLRLDATQAAAFYRAISLPGKPGGTCSAPPTFDVAHTGNAITYVELGGCYRVLRDSSLGRADPTALTAFLKHTR